MKTPEEIADEIVNVASEAAYGDCPKRHMDATDEHCPGCLRSMIAAAIREAEIRGVNAGIVAAAGILSAPHRCVSGSEFECCIDEKAVAIRDLDPAAISAERSAGTSPNDRLVTPKLAVAARSAPAPVRPPAVRVPTPEEIAAMPLEQVAAETARLKRETGAVGGISRCEPAPACARCGGSGYFCRVCSRSECFQSDPCPECRGTP